MSAFINLVAVDSLICSRALMTAHTLVVKMDAESINLMEITLKCITLNIFDNTQYIKCSVVNIYSYLYCGFGCSFYLLQLR